MSSAIPSVGAGCAAGRTAAPTSIDLRTQNQDRAEYERLSRIRLDRILASRDAAPELAEAALHGLAGRIVRAIAPTTEASIPAMLLTLLTAVGAMIGRGAFVRVGPEPHYPSLFSLIVGPSGSGKGVSLSAIRPVLAAADSEASPFLKTRVRKGFQSGEALVQVAAELDVAAVAEPSNERLPDQRLLVIESEYARVLTVTKREGSILSSVLRSAWDGETLEANTRREKLCAEAAHIGVIAHVTATELQSKTDPVDISNGFSNRFLHLWSDLSRLLPAPGALAEEQLRGFGHDLQRCILFGQSIGEIGRTEAFEEAWRSTYYLLRLSRRGGQVFDALTARGAPYVMRLALLFALLDEHPEVDLPHLEAAIAIWEYSEASIAHIWKVTLGSPDLDKLNHALTEAGPTGLTRSAMGEVFSKNRSATQLNALAAQLVDRGLALETTVRTGGRPSLVLRAVQ